MSAASGTEAGGAAEAIQEKTEDKMAAANPQGAAEEAQADVAPAAEGGGAESGAQGESETGAGEGAAAGDQAAGATESEAAAPPQQEAEKSTTAASGSASTDPDAQQREQTSQESREHQADSRRVAEGDSEEHAQDQTEQQADASAGASAPADAEMSSGEKGAGLSDLSEEVAGGGEGAGGAVSGGGGAAAPAAAEDGPAPDTAAQEPADGLASAASLRPVQAGAALTGVSSAVNRTANEEAGALQEQIPSPEVGGDGASVSAVQTLPGDSMTGKPAAVPAGSPVPTAAPAPLPAAGPAPSERVVTPSVSAGEGGTVAAEDATRVQGAVEDLPTHDPGLDVPVGAPPQVQLRGDADPAAADHQKAELDQAVTVQRARGAADAGADAGENAIRVTRPKEIIKAPEIAKGRAGAAMSAIDAGASEQSIGIIANEKKGPEVRAAMVKAQADMATKKGEHQEKVSQEKTRNDEKMAALKDENLAQQQAEKAGAKSEVAKARNDWTAEQRKTIAETNQKAGKEVAKGHEKVNQEQAQGDKQASDHLATGEKEASAAKVNAERDASAKKAEGKQESGGIFGWLSSKVTSFFNKIKNGITAIFDAAKKAVRWAIDKAKKAAVAAIELARKAIVSVIKAVGAALMALGDVLLAAFPSLRKRFRSFIESKVRAAENAVNRLADALKKGVTKLLDLLGKAFEFLLDAYKKGMLMVLDAAHAVVNGAIKFAKAVADLVGTFIVLIKDIAANPGGWISNLGAAVMDGVKNHLWKAFKTAVSGWFNDKLEEVLGVGLTIWNVLKKGGISIKEVGKMAFEALKAAIPSALIQLLIEKVVAMIVPAAGAVMAIIEGLQAAWGTVQRIIAALGKFVSFLKAVKAGGAGPQFAELLAAAAIVVIDFVANWLLKKLRGPASKVGSKVKAIAQKIMAKVKAAMKKVGGALKKVAKKIGGVFKKGSKKFADWRAKRKAKKDAKKAGKKQDPSQKKKDKEEAKKSKKAAALRAVKEKLNVLLGKGVSKFKLGLKLRWWRTLHRFTSLSIKGHSVVARASAEETVAQLTDLQLATELEGHVQTAESQYLEQYQKAREKEQAGGKVSENEPKRSQATEELLQFQAIQKGTQSISGDNARFTPQFMKPPVFRSDHQMSGSQGPGVFANVALSQTEKEAAWSAKQAGKNVSVPKNLTSRTLLSMMEVRGLGPYNKNFQNKEVFSGAQGTLALSPQATTLAALEGARSPGVFATTAVNVAVANESKLSPKEAAQSVFVDKNPMADKGSAGVAHKEHVEGVKFQEGSDNKGLSDKRKLAILNAFKSIRASLKSEKDLLGQNQALAKVSQAFEKWIKARTAAAHGTTDEIALHAKEMVAMLVAFLKGF